MNYENMSKPDLIDSVKKIKYDLGEREKELECIYALSTLLENKENTVEDILKNIVELIPPAWQYPEVTAGRIAIKGFEFTTKNYKKTDWVLSAPIKEQGEEIGTLEVIYLEKKPILDEGPFLKEEKDLLNTMVERIGKTIERIHSENLTDMLFNMSADGIRIIDKNFNIIRVNKTLSSMTGFSINEMETQKCHATLKGSLCNTPECVLKKILAGEKRIEIKIEKTIKDGTKIPCVLVAQPYIDVDGKISGVIEDIKDMKQFLTKQQFLTIFEASTPVIQIIEGVVVTPIIGMLDSERTQQIMEQMLTAIVDTHSQISLIDITGVPSIDTAIAQHLVDTVNAVKLLGAKVVLTGIKPAIAQTLVHLGIDLTGVQTRKSLAEGINVAFDFLNLKIVKKNQES